MSTKPYRDGLYERLKDVSYAREYVKAALEDGDDAVFLLVVSDIVRAHDTTEHTLRKLLWLHHGCPRHALYGDDGEMQCARCGIDFKRRSVDEIEDKWWRQNATGR
jgi:hypothetical protein